MVRSVAIDSRLPTGSLFVVHTSPASHYLIETDPRFASYRQWLSSDYLLHSLELDPALTQKRLGDGFYEQRLVREQVAQLTGRRFLEGYGDDEAQYQALMDNGATFAQTHNLRPGVALSAEQMAALTSDIVWLVEETVTLADGSTAQVLVPKVYVQVKEGDLQASGALIVGGSVDLDVGGELSNSGTIAGRSLVALTAENVRNLGGRILGSDVGVQARDDLDNLGGTIAAENSLVATAGRDLNAVSPTRSQANNNGKRTNIERVAGLYVTGGRGSLIATAGRDLNLMAAAVDNGGSGATVLSAGNNLNFGTVEESANNRIVWDRANHRSDASRTDAGTIVHTKGDLRLQAGLDLNLKAADIATETGDLLATAGRDVNLRTGEASVFYDEAHRSTSKGMFSTTTTTTRDTVAQTSALGTTLSGEAATVFAGRDINVLGGNIVSTAETFLAAGENIGILAASDFLSEYHFKQERKTGLMGSGGVGFTIGTQVKSTEQQGGYTTAAASTIGSVEGDVSILAGRNYLQTGSNVLAPRGDIDIQGQQVDILEALEAGRSTTELKYRKSGLTIALTSPVISAVQTAQQMRSAAKDTKDARMKALAGATTVLAAGNAAQAVGETPQAAGGFGISITVGGSRNESTTTETSDTAALSQVRAGKDIHIAATGAGRESDLTLQGAQVEAGGSVTLKAEDELRLLAARSESDLHRKSSGASGGIGVAVQVGKGVAAGITVNASGSRGKAEGNDVIHSNTHVEAGDTVILQSGGDTTLKGAVVAGERVKADVGGNLTIESLQDESHYHSKDQSVGGSITVGYGFAAGGAGFSNSKINSDFISVTEQSGLLAGDGGFDVTVKGNTDLKGGVIASTDTAVDEDRNRFTTGSLTMSDIANKAEYDAKGFSVGGSYSTGEARDQQGNIVVNNDGTSKMVNSPAASAGFGQDSGSAASVTTSGISGIAGNTEVRTGDQETGIKPIFDAERVQKEIDAQVAITQQFGQQASKAVGDYADSKMREANSLRDQAGKEPDPEKRAALLIDTQAIDDQWGANGTLRLAAHTVVGALTGGVSGAAGAAVGTFTAAQVGEQLAKAGITGTLADTLTGLASTAAGAAAGAASGGPNGGTAGATTALNEVANNYLKHDEALRLADLKNKKLMGQCDVACERDIADLERLDRERNIELVACQGVDSSGCNNARQEVRFAAAEYIRKGNWASDLQFIGIYASEHDETLGYAKETLDGKALGMVQGAGGAALDVATGSATLVNALLGFSYAQQAVVQGAGAAWEYVGNPDNWPYLLGAMTPGQREQLAQAYEQGDGNAVGRIMGEQVFNILTNLDTGGMAGGIKLVKAGEKAGDVAGDVKRITQQADNISLLDQKATTHILDGDSLTSGGHRYGTGNPGKSEFPKNWSDEKILSTISDIATDPSVVWSKPDARGYVSATASREGIDVKVIYDTKSNRVVTGYPTNMPRNMKP